MQCFNNNRQIAHSASYYLKFNLPNLHLAYFFFKAVLYIITSSTYATQKRGVDYEGQVHVSFVFVIFHGAVNTSVTLVNIVVTVNDFKNTIPNCSKIVFATKQ